MILSFLSASAVIAAASVFAFKLALWKAILIFIFGPPAFTLLYMLFFTVVSAFVDNTKPIERQSRLCARGVVGISRLALGWCGVKTRVVGIEKLPEGECFQLVANHRSLFDPLIIVRCLKKYNVSFIGKPSALAIPVIGKIGYGAGCLPIDRENNRNALKTVVTAINYVKTEICSMAVFPEGTRNKTDAPLLPFRAGCFKIAQKANAPLVIACIKGSRDISKNMFRRKTETELVILEVISAEKNAAMSTAQLADHSSRLIEKCYTE
ncbi:MAG: lysophospholipid acyltransferase family protein [Eubacteriales bacterium]|nr:lysophospholipid acyltransferase family protein [Eubacteriales bacterium]